MFLRRLKINGFKSFANKTTLEFEPGISAIVGPNGSGKSNVADAIRWALGEQSVKNLRLKKSEELVFAGTEKRPKASLAEVTMLLDNSDGGMAIDFSEVELSRLLYGSGESEYRLNGRKVPLREVQQLLAQSGFGPNSYAVIGQGMIDNLILATPAERKLLFDEASGIRQYELKREQALRKLDATSGNLTRVRDIMAELSPRLKTLQRGVEAAQARAGLASELTAKRQRYLQLAQSYHSLSISQIETDLKVLSKSSKDVQSHIDQLEQQRSKMESAYAGEATARAEQSQQLHDLEVERDELSNDLSVKRAELQFMIDGAQALAEDQKRLEQLEQELTKAHQAESALTDKIKAAQAAEAAALARQDELAVDIKAAQTELSKLRRASESTDRHEYVVHALGVLKQLALGLRENSINSDQLQLMVHKAGRLLGHASAGQTDTLADMKQLQSRLNNLMKRRDDRQEEYATAVIKLRSLELDIQHAKGKITHLSEQIQAQTRTLSGREQAGAKTMPERRRKLAEIRERLQEIDRGIGQLRRALAGGTETRSPVNIFSLAAELETAKSSYAAGRQQQSERTDSLTRNREALGELKIKAKTWGLQDQIDSLKNEKSLGQDQVLNLEREIAVLEGRLNADDEADQTALAEYQEVSQRSKFMNEQVADLEAAQADLTKIIAALEGLIKTKFEAAFKDIAQHFTAYFERVFNGGRAALNLQPDDRGVYGIEIKAVPPGKRVESLNTLSGGELALTGIALLAAILHVNPSPFVVLDEVDAALDEANSGRLASILKEIAKRSQLIVITHNRQTMQAAHSLFGVTMDEHHVSKLLSVRLEEAKEFVQA